MSGDEEDSADLGDILGDSDNENKTLLPKSAGNKKKQPAKYSPKPKLWWRAIMWFTGVVSLSILVIITLSCIFQYMEFNRVHTINKDTEEPRKDTETRFTAAFIVSAPFQAVAMLFSGAVIAYLPSRAADSKSYLGAVSTVDVVLYGALVTLCVVYLGPGFWYFDDLIRDEANEVHSKQTDDFEWAELGSVPYATHWFTSPLSAWVRGTNIYILFASIFQYICIVAVFLFQRKTKGQRDKDLNALSRASNALTKGRKVLIWMLDIITLLFFLGALSHIVLVTLSYFTNAFDTVDSTPIFWALYINCVNLSPIFFLLGWCFYFAVTRSWWVYPAQAEGEFGASLLSIFITFLVSAGATITGIIHIAFTQNDCGDTLFSPIEGDSELKIGVCNMILEERTEHPAVIFWLRFNAIWLTSCAGFIVLLSLVSIALRPQKLLKNEKVSDKEQEEEEDDDNNEIEDEDAYFLETTFPLVTRRTKSKVKSTRPQSAQADSVLDDIFA